MLPPITHQTYIDAPATRVFDAIATAEGWTRWFTDAAHIDAHAGGSYDLRWDDFGPEHVQLELRGRIITYSNPDRFAFEWASGTERTVVSLQLEPRHPGTVVSVTEEGYSNSDAQLRACLECAVGWGEALTLLKMYLEHGVTYGRAPQAHAGEGPEAATSASRPEPAGE